MNLLSVVILAAGNGSRMVSKEPKVLHRLADKYLLDHVIDAVLPLKPAQIFTVYGHEGQAVLSAMRHRDSQLTWVKQIERAGTGHAVLQVLPHLSLRHQVLIVCGDVPLISTATLRRLIEATPENQLGVITAPVPRPAGLGRIIRDEQGHVVSIVEEKDASAVQKQISEINAGIYCVPALLLAQWLPQLQNYNSQKEYYLTEIIQFARHEKIPVITVCPEKVEEIYGINTRIELADLERIYQTWQCEALMLQGVTLLDPSRVDIRGKVIPARDCIIDINVVLKGRVVLGENCIIGAGCILEDVQLAADVIIQPHSIIQSAEIGKSCVVGPFARIRPHTRLAAQVHIGNFVELKNACIAENSKASHLSYLGDVTVGKNVNIGAGVITCNYDGAEKHLTCIEDDAFIGSDVQLIAPVCVGQGATIGAGTTLVGDAPAGKLTVGRAKQQTREGWVRPQKKIKATREF